MIDLNLVYIDESGDEGYPRYSSDYFVLTSLYFSHEIWKSNFQKLYEFKRELKNIYPEFLVKMEFHCKEFICDKNPYHGKFSRDERKDILFKFANCISGLDIKIILTFIDKLKIKRSDYLVLENSMNYSMSRIDLDMREPVSNFLVITDEGRIDKMRKISRKKQIINFVPGAGRNAKIERMIEDPLPKSSGESFFIQAADFCSYIEYLYVQRHIRKGRIANRVAQMLTDSDIKDLMDIIEPRFNLKASRNKYGIVIYPK